MGLPFLTRIGPTNSSVPEGFGRGGLLFKFDCLLERASHGLYSSVTTIGVDVLGSATSSSIKSSKVSSKAVLDDDPISSASEDARAVD